MTSHAATPPIFATSGLTKRYGATVGIEGLDLTLERGEILGFLGPNGAGKTTTIRLLLGFLRPTAGAYDLFGERVNWGQWRHRSRMGFLPGDLRFPRRMSGRALLSLLCSIQGRCDWSWIGELSERLSLDLDRRVRSLSRGNQQKLGIVQALMHRPELLILDEPTTALDPIVQRTVLGLLREMRDAGTTVFFSSHNITEVEKICNRVAMVRAGRLASVESVEALRSRRLARVEIRLTDNQTAPEWSGVGGVIRSELRDGRHILTTRGQPGPLLRVLASLEVESVTWEPARLEEHFFEICEDAP